MLGELWLIIAWAQDFDISEKCDRIEFEDSHNIYIRQIDIATMVHYCSFFLTEVLFSDNGFLELITAVLSV